MSLVIDTATPSLEALSKKLKQRKRIHTAMARAVANQFRDHFKSLSKSNKNRFGVKNSFWDRMRSTVREEATDTVSAISMDRAVALRRFGGPVKPTGNRRYLTIPLSRRSYGKKATEFEESFVITIKKKANERKYIVIKREDGGLDFLYLMIESTTHKPNSLAIPSDNDVQRIVFGTLAKHLSNG